MRRYVLALALLTIPLAGCGASVRKFPLRDPLWRDDDQKPFKGPIEEYWSPLAWDAADQTIFRPVSRFFAVSPGGESVNVNAFDEVPESSWFTARAGKLALSRDDFAEGACKGRPKLSTTEKWKVIRAKPNGANPGFMIKAQDGRKYLIKYEVDQIERASSADAIGSRIYYAAGFDGPCNNIVFMKPDILEIADDAKTEEDGKKVPLAKHHLDKIFEVAAKTPEGTYRASASLLFEEKTLGPWTYQGTRDDDPNDAIPHEDRRDVRGQRLLGAWLNHFDAREQNTMALWVGKDHGYVRHSLLDWGDCFGSIWPWDRLTRRFGYSYYLAFDHVLADFFTLGLYPRPWDDVKIGPAGRVFAYFDVDHFKADEWRPGYPNPAFGRMTEHDGAWMARIIAKIDNDAVDAIVDAAQIKNAVTDRELRKILKGRRERILRRYLSQLSPLSKPEIAGDSLCVEDLAVSAGLATVTTRKYSARAFIDATDEVQIVQPTSPSAGRVCTTVPKISGASQTSPRYITVDIVGTSPGFSGNPLRVHLYDLGGTFKVVGVERPD
jgi:hypothetical protein